jgi:hypothetical protein
MAAISFSWHNGAKTIIKSPQHDGVRTTIKKGTPKILSKSISRMPMGSLVGQKNLICHRILQRKK